MTEAASVFEEAENGRAKINTAPDRACSSSDLGQQLVLVRSAEIFLLQSL